MRVVIGSAILVEGILSDRRRHGFDGPRRASVNLGNSDLAIR